MPDLEINPKTVALGAGQSQLFAATLMGKPPEKVEWSATDGTIEDSGAYRSPRFVVRSRKVVITATAVDPDTPQATATATATVELSSISLWTQLLGIYWFLCFAALVFLVSCNWKRLCPTCTLLVSPPVVTLTPNDTQLFTANAPVTWSPMDAANGLYRAPGQVVNRRVSLVAASKGNPEETATAEVFLTTDFGLSLHPEASTIAAGSIVDLTAVLTPAGSNPTAQAEPTVVEWLKPAIGAIATEGGNDRKAKFRAPATTSVSLPTTVVVLARTRGDIPRIAGAHITITAGSKSTDSWQSNDCASRTAVGLLALIATMGALGGLVHGISSFATYVGNRELVPSWIWWYIFKPFLGALVAVVVYLVFRAGLGGNDYSLSSADCLKTAAFAALIGLFAEPATVKLKDIFETLFTPKDDPRRDAAGKEKKGAPKIESLDPSSVKTGQSPPPSLKVIGSGFSENSKVKIGLSLRETTFVSPTELRVPLTQDDVKSAQDLVVIVFNQPPDKLASDPQTLKVVP